MKTAIVCCVTSNWLPAAAVTLLTARREGRSTAEAIICAPEITPTDQANFARFNQKHGLDIRILPVDVSGLERSDLSRFGVGSLIRLTLDSHIDASYDRVLYLDADVLVSSDISALLSVSLDGKTLGAVPDIGILSEVRPKVDKHRQSLGLQPGEPYFNSGVLLFDWKATLARDALRRAREMLASRAKWISPDQDALNLALKSEWKALPYTWNATAIIVNYTDFEPAITHYTASEKPWGSRRHLWHRRVHRLYQEALAGTGWSPFVERRTIYTLLRATGEGLRHKTKTTQSALIREIVDRGV